MLLQQPHPPGLNEQQQPHKGRHLHPHQAPGVPAGTTSTEPCNISVQKGSSMHILRPMHVLLKHRHVHYSALPVDGFLAACAEALLYPDGMPGAKRACAHACAVRRTRWQLGGSCRPTAVPLCTAPGWPAGVESSNMRCWLPTLHGMQQLASRQARTCRTQRRVFLSCCDGQAWLPHQGVLVQPNSAHLHESCLRRLHTPHCLLMRLPGC